jgi:hypothetical protein
MQCTWVLSFRCYCAALITKAGAYRNHLATSVTSTSLPSKTGIDGYDVARATFTVLSQCIDQGEIEKVLKILPSELRALWPAPEATIDASR